MAQSTGGWAVKYTSYISSEGYDPPNKCPTYDIKQSDGEAPVILELWGNVEYSFIAIVPRFTGPKWKHLIRDLSMGQKSVWHLNCMQTNDLCLTELLEIELFDY